MTIRELVIAEMKERGRMTTVALSIALDRPQGALSSTMSRLEKAGIIKKTGKIKTENGGKGSVYELTGKKINQATKRGTTASAIIESITSNEKTIDEISDETGIARAIVSSTCGRLEKQGEIVVVGKSKNKRGYKVNVYRVAGKAFKGTQFNWMGVRWSNE